MSHQNIRIASADHACRRTLGHSLDRSEYRVPLPIDRAVDDGTMRVEPAADGPGHPAPPALLSWLLEHAPQHAVGSPTESYAAIERRLRALPSMPPPRDATDLLGEGARLDLVAHARFAREALALPREAVTGVPADVLDEVFASEHAIWPWDGEGARLDAEHDHAVATAAREVERARREKEEAAKPNESSVGELGLLAIRIPVGGKRPATLAYLDAAKAIEDVYLVRGDCFGLAIPEGKVEGTDAIILPSTYVPRVTRRDLEERTHASNARDLLRLRRVPTNTPVDIATLRDLRGPEGEHAEAAFRVRVRELADRLTGPSSPDRAMHETIVFEAGIRGYLLRPEVVAETYAAVVTPLLGMVEGERTLVSEFFDADGSRIPNAGVCRVPTGQPMAGRPYRSLGRVQSRLAGEGYFASANGIEQVEYLSERLVEVQGPPRRELLPLTPEQIAKHVASAMAGAHPLIGIGELDTPPSAEFVARFQGRAFREDGPWLELLRAVTAGRDFVVPADLDKALLGAGLVSGKMKTADYARLKKLMTEDGWTVRQISVGNEHPRRWCRA